MTPPVTSLVALRDRRQQVIQLLSDAYADDLLDLPAFEDRMARAHAAGDLVSLDALVVDLQPATRTTALAPLVQPGLPAPPRRRVLALFSSVERRGVWQVPAAFAVSSVFGSTELDFREAVFQPGTTELEVRAIFGSVEITVPPHLAVECDGQAIFGSFEHREGGAAVLDPERPRLVIRGSAVFGNVEVRVRPPGGPWKQLAAAAKALLTGRS